MVLKLGCILTLKRGPVRGGLYVPRLNFKPFHVAISDGSHVAVGISSKSTDIDIAGNANLTIECLT